MKINIVVGGFLNETAKDLRGWESASNNPIGLALQDKLGISSPDVEVDTQDTSIQYQGRFLIAKHSKDLQETLEDYFWNQGENPFPENKKFEMEFKEKDSFGWNREVDSFVDKPQCEEVFLDHK